MAGANLSRPRRAVTPTAPMVLSALIAVWRVNAASAADAVGRKSAVDQSSACASRGAVTAPLKLRVKLPLSALSPINSICCTSYCSAAEPLLALAALLRVGVAMLMPPMAYPRSSVPAPAASLIDAAVPSSST